MSVHPVSTLQFPSTLVDGFNWEVVKKIFSITDHAYDNFRNSSVYVGVCLVEDEDCGDLCEYGVNDGVLWQDTKTGLTGRSRKYILELVVAILSCADMGHRDGTLEFQGTTIRWYVRKSS